MSEAPRPRSQHAVSLAEVARCAGAPATADDMVRVTGVSLDSRAVRTADLYAALPGANAHGAAFAGGAVANGAAAVLTDPAGAALLGAGSANGTDGIGTAGIGVPVLVVADPRAVLGEVAALVYGRAGAELTMLGLTGTNGKTTTAYLLDSALRALGRVTGLIGTVETRIGDERIKSVRTTPESTDLHALFALMRERGVDTCTMEVSSHALALHRVDGVRYDVAAFTNLSQDHLDFHGTMEHYFAAKATLFTAARAVRGVVCVDDEWGRRLADEATVPVVTVTSLPGLKADWRLEPASAGAGVESGFDLVSADARLRLRSALPGDFNRVNTAVAALVLLAIGVEAAEVERAIGADPHVPGRMERVAVVGAPGGEVPLAVVDFAHTPDAVAAALTALRHDTAGSLIVVLGAGGDRDAGKREGMGAAAAAHADQVVVTDDNPRSEDPAAIRAAVLAGARGQGSLGQRSQGHGARVHEVAGRAEAILAAVALATSALDTVVVLGKGHETGQEIAGTVHPFDDREVLRAALAACAQQTDPPPGDAPELDSPVLDSREDIGQ